MNLIGANHEAHISGLDELPGKNNYFIGGDPNKWRMNVRTYAKVKYHRGHPIAGFSRDTRCFSDDLFRTRRCR
jgi:hypothetical protein